MARINTYEVDSNISADDLLLGTDGDPNMGLATKNFTIGELTEFVMQYFETHSPCCGGTPTTTTTTTAAPNVIGINDIVLSFSDEAKPVYVESGGTAGIGWVPDVDYWIANMSAFNPNNFLTFDIGVSFEDLYPTVGVVAPYDAPPNGVSNIINIARPTEGDPISQAAFYASLKETLETKYGINIWNDLATQSRRIVMFIDTSGSMDRATIGLGIDEFELFLTTNGITWQELTCSNEQWIRWLVNSALNVIDCN